MNRITTNWIAVILSILMISLLTISCKNNKEKEVNPFNPMEIELQVLSADVEYPYAGGTGEIKMNSSNFSFTSDVDTWLTATKEGDKIILNVSSNAGPELRTALLTIKDASKTGEGNIQRVSISQLGITNILEVTAVDLPLMGGKANFDLSKINEPLQVTYPKGSDQWISHTIKDGVLEISVDQTKAERTGSVVVSAGVMKSEIPVSQTVHYVDLIGEYEAHYWLEFNWTERHQTWKLLPLEENKSFVLTGFGLDLIVYYDANTHALTIPCGVHALTTNPEGYDLYAWTAWEIDSGSLSWHSDFSFVAPLAFTPGQFQFHFGFQSKGHKFTATLRDKSKKEGFVPKGMIVWKSQVGQLKLEGKDAQLYDLTITKVL